MHAKFGQEVKTYLTSGRELPSRLIAKVCSRPFQGQERISCLLRFATILWLGVFCFVCLSVHCEEGMLVGTCCCTGVPDLAAVGVNQRSSSLTSLVCNSQCGAPVHTSLCASCFPEVQHLRWDFAAFQLLIVSEAVVKIDKPSQFLFPD